jgi:hypothetical protein
MGNMTELTAADGFVLSAYRADPERPEAVSSCRDSVSQPHPQSVPMVMRPMAMSLRRRSSIVTSVA